MLINALFQIQILQLWLF